MSNAGSSLYHQPLSDEERRHQVANPDATPRRRIGDTAFNKVRWPIFVYSWFGLGFALLAYILYRVFAT